MWLLLLCVQVHRTSFKESDTPDAVNVMKIKLCLNETSVSHFAYSSDGGVWSGKARGLSPVAGAGRSRGTAQQERRHAVVQRRATGTLAGRSAASIWVGTISKGI